MCQFLDLDIPPFQGKYKIRVYDKREDFPFPIVNFPFLDREATLVPSARHMVFIFFRWFALHLNVIISVTSFIVIL